MNCLLRILLFFLVLPISAVAGGGPFLLESGRGRITLYGGSGATESYLSPYGENRRFDTVGTRFQATTFGLVVDYGFWERFEATFELPLGYYSLTSDSRFPDRSVFAPAWIGFGIGFQALRQPIAIAAHTIIRPPPGFHRGIYDDPAHPTFLSDGYLQVATGLSLGKTFGGIWLKGSGAYNWRDEEPVDELLLSGEVGVSRTEGTGAFLGTDAVVALADVSQPAVPFYAGSSDRTIGRLDGGTGRFSTIDRETYVAIRAGVFVDILTDLTLSGQYKVRLFGYNTLALQEAHLALTHSF